jgi:hypothetical protein
MRYSVSHTKAGINTVDSPMWQVRPGSNDDCYIYEIGLSIATAPTNAPQWRLVKATTIGTAATQATPVIEGPGSNTANARLDLTWSAAPTIAAQTANSDYRRYSHLAPVGNGIVWTWYDAPLYMPAGAGLVIANGAAAGTTLGSMNIYVRFDE